MPINDTKILVFNQYQKLDKTPSNIYVDLESLINKMDRCKNNPQKLSTVKVREHIQPAFSMITPLSFKDTENKHDLHRGEDYTKKVSRILEKKVKEDN